MEKKVKILFVYKDSEGDLAIESLWATPVGNLYEVDNIPFYINNIAYKDIVSAEIEDEQLYFDELVEASGNSTIQIVFFDESKIPSTLKELERLGCEWEGSDLPLLFSLNIPKNTNFNKIKFELEELSNEKTIDYKEACLGFK